jgi:hypothetical protein
LVKNELSEKARANPQASRRSLVASSRSGLSDEALVKLPKGPALEQIIDRARKVPGRTDVDISDLQQIRIEVCPKYFLVNP